jgi:Rieske Fe-S protein
MDRMAFIKTCGYACLGASTLGVLLQSCAGSKMITGQLSGDYLTMPVSSFEIEKNAAITYRKYIVVQHEQLKYPICVYRFSDSDYSALYLQCTHQGNELTVYGDKMVCSAHGSEFDQRGNVTQPPADRPLRSFPVMVENNSIHISLKAS